MLLNLLPDLAQLVEELVPILTGGLVSWFCHEEGSRAGLAREVGRYNTRSENVAETFRGGLWYWIACALAHRLIASPDRIFVRPGFYLCFLS